MANSKIEWTEETWNPIVGCSLQSPGCTNCYAMSLAARLAAISIAHEAKHGVPGPLAHYRGTTVKVKNRAVWTGEMNVAPDSIFLMPLRRKKPTMFFVNSMSDLFHPDVPDEIIDRAFAVMALCPQHEFQVLTKRAARMREYLTPKGETRHAEVVARIWEAAHALVVEGTVLHHSRETEALYEGAGWPLPNVWLGVSVEDQKRADERIPDLLNTPAAVRWLSCEPLLGPVDLRRICLIPKLPLGKRAGIHIDALRGRYVESGLAYVGEWDVREPYPEGARALSLDWVVVGGERGDRPMHPDWARNLREQCGAASTDFFFKQHGDWVSVSMVEGAGRHHRFEDGTTVRRVGKKAAGRVLDGATHNEMPEAVRG